MYYTTIIDITYSCVSVCVCVCVCVRARARVVLWMHKLCMVSVMCVMRVV